MNYYELHREERLIYQKNYVIMNKDKVKATQKKYYENNKEKRLSQERYVKQISIEPTRCEEYHLVRLKNRERYLARKNKKL